METDEKTIESTGGVGAVSMSPSTSLLALGMCRAYWLGRSAICRFRSKAACDRYVEEHVKHDPMRFEAMARDLIESANSVLCVNDRSTGTSPVGAKSVVT